MGLSGRVACTLNTNSVVNFVDLESGETKKYQPTDILPESGKVPSTRIQATLQGMLVYLTGQRGIQCVNTRTSEALYSVPWPASVQPEYASAPSPTPNLHGSFTRYPSHMQMNPAMSMHPQMTSTVATIQDGVFYTLSADDTVVALKGASVDGR